MIFEMKDALAELMCQSVFAGKGEFLIWLVELIISPTNNQILMI